MTFSKVSADPYAWPYDGIADPACIAVMCIDWQTDFCGQGNYQAALKMVKMQGGVFGAVASSLQFLGALNQVS